MKKHYFSLVETMVASFLLVLISSGIYGSIYSANRMAVTAKNHQAALTLASDELWATFNMDLTELSSLWSQSQSSAIQKDIPTDHLLGKKELYNGVVETFIIDNVDHFDITVRVSWIHYGKSVSQEYSIKRYKTDR